MHNATLGTVHSGQLVGSVGGITGLYRKINRYSHRQVHAGLERCDQHFAQGVTGHILHGHEGDVVALGQLVHANNARV